MHLRFFSNVCPLNKTNRVTLENIDSVIIGAGPSGLSAATALIKHNKKVFIIEKETRVGGKCFTFSDPNNAQNKTEWGAALIAANYGKVIDQIKEKKLSWESVLPSNFSTIPFMKNIDKMSFIEKASFGLEFSKQMLIFSKHAKEYQRLRDAHDDLPCDYKCSFDTFTKKYHCELINEFSYLFVPAFGYGLLEKCPAYAIFEYYGMTTIPDIILGKMFFNIPLLSIKNGFQSLMEEISKDFPIQLNSVVESIERSPKGVVVNFKSNNDLFTIHAKHLILAISPLHWPKLGMDLTEIEKTCVDELTYYQYPVAAVKLKGFSANQYFEYKGLTERGLGHLALVTTRDNRDQPEDGRLCTAYINLKERKGMVENGPNYFEFTPDKIKQLEHELLQLPEVTNVEILETKVWQDYMSTLPWNIRLDLDKSQMAFDSKTLYVGPYTLGGFEDVACVWEQADKIISEHLLNKKLSYDAAYYLNEMQRAAFFYTAPKKVPFNDPAEVKPALRYVSRPA